MEIPIFPSDRPLQPKDQIKIEQLVITPYRDRFRVHVHIQVTPFQERPNLLLVARDDQNRIVSELNIIETMHHDMEFTLHLRGLTDPAGSYTLLAELFYETRNPSQDRRTEPFTIPEASASEA
ncbi:MAG TPA: hypothetical protein VHO69_02770 [Phototrophicaceae bacterium]|nr:hypothetical protein [Phototrophicaceae bacterium]